MTTTATLNPQIIGQAENAHLPVLGRILARTGTSRHQWVALSLTANAGGTVEARQLAARITGALKIDAATAATAVRELIDTGLLAQPAGDPARLSLTASGQGRHGAIRAAVDEVIARAYRDIPAGDLATAARVLTLITTRLNTEEGTD